MTEYTPGPWAAFDAVLKGVKVRQFLIQPKEGHEHPNDFSDIIAEIPWQHFSEEERQANARLIAAAPDLLEAAKAFVAINECACPTPQDMPFDEELPAFPEWIKTNRCYWHKARAAIAAAEGVE